MAKTTTTKKPAVAKPKAPASRAAAAAKPAPKPASRAAAKSAAPQPAAAKPNTITLRNISATMADRHELPKKQAEGLVTGVFETIVEHLKAGERVRINGLGIIEVKNRPARMARNPATGEPVQVKASRKVAFRAAKDLKDAI